MTLVSTNLSRYHALALNESLSGNKAKDMLNIENQRSVCSKIHQIMKTSSKLPVTGTWNQGNVLVAPINMPQLHPNSCAFGRQEALASMAI
jgi:hypothetical protein